MEVIVSGRGGGKTHRMLEWASRQENPDRIAIVCHNRQMASLLEKRWAQEHGERSPRPLFLTPHEAKEGRHFGRRIEKVGYDDVELLLQIAYRLRPDVGTVSGSTVEKFDA